MAQGRYLDVQKVIKLLESDISMTAIAERLGVTRTAIAKLNQRYKIRIYNGKRDTWSLTKDSLPTQ